MRGALRLAGALLLSAASILVVLVAAEALLRVAADRLLPAWGWSWSESPYRGFPVEGQVGEFGLRGRPVDIREGDFVVVLVGDSYVEAGAQPLEDMPERLFEEMLRSRYGIASARVFSVASAGWGQDQQLLALRAWLARHRADVVIDWLTPVNDFWENTFVERSVTPQPGRLKPTYSLDAQGGLHGPRTRHSEVLLLDLLRRARAALRGGDAAQSLAAAEMHRWNARLPSARRPPAGPGECPAREVPQEDMIAAVRAGAQALTILSPEDVSGARTHFAPWGVPPSPRESYQVALTRALLERMATLSREHGARFAAFYPRGSDIDRALGHVRCVREQASGHLYRVDLRDPLAPLNDPDPGFPVLAPALASGEATTLSSGDWHLNRHGNLLALRGLAGALRGLGWLRPAP